MKIILKIKEKDGIHDFDIQNDGVRIDLQKSIEKFFEEMLFWFLDTGYYDIKTFYFEASNEVVNSKINNYRKINCLDMKYGRLNGDWCLIHSWNGCREMKDHSSFFMKKFDGIYGLNNSGFLSYLTDNGFNEQTMKMNIKTIKKYV